jgi:hypothetical protein
MVLGKGVLMNLLLIPLLPYISPQPGGIWCEGMVHRWGTWWVQGTLSQGSERVGMAGILPLAYDTWSSPKSLDVASEWTF